MTSSANAADLENTLYLELKDGRVVIEMFPDKAPKHVARIKELVREGFYDGIVFHRVIEGFMAQTGDPTGTGMGGSGQNLDAEFNDVKHTRGVVSMARATNPNSADSQWFIVFDDANFLDGQYTAWGKVTEGMQYVDRIKKGDANRNGEVTDPDKIITLRLADSNYQPAVAATDTRQLASTEKSAIVSKVKSKLKDEFSAKFKWLPLNNDKKNVYCAEVNAKNSYGGYTGYTPFYAYLTWNGGKLESISSVLLGSADPEDSDNRNVRNLCRNNGYFFD